LEDVVDEVVHGGLYRALFDEVFGELAGLSVPGHPEPTGRAASIDPARFAGTFERLGVRMEFTAVDGGLELQLTDTRPLAAVQPAIPPLRLRAVDETVFLAKGPTSPLEIPVVFFDFDDEGRPGFVHFGARATPRVVVS